MLLFKFVTVSRSRDEISCELIIPREKRRNEKARYVETDFIWTRPEQEHYLSYLARAGPWAGSGRGPRARPWPVQTSTVTSLGRSFNCIGVYPTLVWPETSAPTESRHYAATLTWWTERTLRGWKSLWRQSLKKTKKEREKREQSGRCESVRRSARGY